VPDNQPATKADLDSLEQRVRVAVKAEVDSLENRLLERLERSETNLLREFRKWALSFESRFRATEVLVGGFNERMVSLEEGVSDLERKQ
jgi:hypothetical protein